MKAALAGLPAYFLGYRNDGQLAPLYAGSDLFVFPSRTDTLGQVVMEAQACGLPAIVSNEGGPKEIVADGVTGLVLPGNDAGALVPGDRRAARTTSPAATAWPRRAAAGERFSLERRSRASGPPTRPLSRAPRWSTTTCCPPPPRPAGGFRLVKRSLKSQTWNGRPHGRKRCGRRGW